MTTAVTIHAHHIPDDKKVEILRGGRVEATLLLSGQSHTTHVWDGASITVAETPFPQDPLPHPTD